MNKALMKEKETKIKKRITMSAPLLEKMGTTVEAFERVTLNALISNPDIAECTTESVEYSVMKCIEAGLLPDREQAVILPFKGEAVLIPMITGRLMLARRATKGLSLRVRVVYKADEWEYEEGLNPILRHIPSMTGSRHKNDIIACYAVAVIPGADAPEFVVMTRGDIDRAKSMSSSGDRGPWGQYYAEMAEVRCLGKLLKRLPKRAGDPTLPPDMDFADVDEIQPNFQIEADEAGEAEDPNAGKPEQEAETPRKRKPKPKPKPEPEPEPEPEPDPPAEEEDDDDDLF